MTVAKKHHYREASKSDHLAKEDLIGKQSPIVYRIDHCEWFDTRKISGKVKDNCIVAFFVDKSLKPWVVNQGNAKIISDVVGSPYAEDWHGFEIEFYVDHSVTMMKKVVGGIKVRPAPQLQVMNQSHRHWEVAIQKVKAEGWTIEQMREVYQISEEDYALCQK